MTRDLSQLPDNQGDEPKLAKIQVIMGMLSLEDVMSLAF